VRLRETTPSEALAEVGGVNVHAKVVIDGRDRPRLERLCRYIARPPLAQDRLELHHDGRLRYTFKRAWKDGTHAVLLDPLDLIARLCTLVPPPRVHMLRYHGVLAANANMARRSEATSTLAPGDRRVARARAGRLRAVGGSSDVAPRWRAGPLSPHSSPLGMAAAPRFLSRRLGLSQVQRQDAHHRGCDRARPRRSRARRARPRTATASATDARAAGPAPAQVPERVSG